MQAGAGAGSILLYYLTNLYTFASDSNWWQWNGTSWTNVGPNDPSVQSVSPDGAEDPPAAEIIDTSGNTWTIGAGNAVLRNGTQAEAGTGTILLFSNANKIYTYASDNAWWNWTGSSWTRIGPVKPNLGDLDKNHLVNVVDWSQMNSKWFTNDATADLNKDGKVNAIDFSLMNANWGKTW